MSEYERPAGEGSAHRAARGPIVGAGVVGLGIGPAVAAGAAVGGAAPPVLAAILMIALSAIGVAGLVVSLVRWVSATRRLPEVPTGPDTGEAFRFASLGQRASFALSAILLLILIVGGPVVLALHLTGPQDGPGKDVGAILVTAIALLTISGLVVPTIAAQVAWTWRRAASRAEAVVLARAVPGPRRMIIAARVVAVTAWTLSITGAIITSALLVGEAAQRLHAIETSYSARDAAGAVRGALLDRYVVGDIRCPASLPDPGTNTDFTCQVTSLGRTALVPAEWFPSGFGTGAVTVPGSTRPHLTRVADLPGPVPKAVALKEDITAAALTAEVRKQLVDEGWGPTSRAVQQMTCPSVSRDLGSDADSSFVRCTVGRNPETQRNLDVYPVAGGSFTARTAEIADLPR